MLTVDVRILSRVLLVASHVFHLFRGKQQNRPQRSGRTGNYHPVATMSWTRGMLSHLPLRSVITVKLIQHAGL